MGKRPNWGVWLVALGAAMWGTDALMRQPLIDLGLSSVAIVLAEHILLAIYAIPAIVLNRSSIRLLRPVQWGAVIFIAWGASGLATILFTEGFKQGDPTTVILLQKTQPIFAIILARLALGERMPAAYWPCFALAMGGAYLVAFSTWEPFWRLPQAPVAATVLALSAALLWGAGTVMGRFALRGLDFHALTGLRFLLALPFLMILAIPNGGMSQAVYGISVAPLTVALLAFIPGLVGMLLYYKGLTRTPAAMATLAELAFPITAIIAGWFLYGRIPTPTQFVGFAVLFLALFFLTRVDTVRASVPSAGAAAGASTAA